MNAVRRLGLKIGLHTAGPYPARFAAILPLCDWVGFDVKAPFSEYVHVTGAAGSGEKARESLLSLLAGGVAHQVRTTVDPSLLDEAAVKRMGAELAALGVAQHTLQEFRLTGTRLDRPAHV